MWWCGGGGVVGGVGGGVVWYERLPCETFLSVTFFSNIS